MPQKPSKLSLFWEELKRRRVIHVITVYATSAFVIIELVGNLAEPLNLPTVLPTIVIIVLAVGFPLAIVLSWIYDLTSEGVEKTKPLEEIKEGEKRTIPNAWKIATLASFVVIIGLVTLNIVGSNKGLRSGDIQSLAILPFDNFTGDEQLDWVAAGMHSSLIGDMGKVSGLRVLGKTTSNTYRETDMTATDIAKKHNVDALVEPTLTCYGDMVCVQVRVITPYPEEKLLWVEDYMEDKSQMLNLYNRITKQIADELRVNLTQQEETLLAESRMVDPEAYDAYLNGIYHLDQINPQALPAAIESFKKAIEIEPDWAAPYAGLSEVGGYSKQMGFGSESDNIRMIYENLNKALELDPYSVESHYRKAGTAAWTEFDWVKAEEEFLKAIELNPSHVRSHSFYAHVLTILRRTDEALHHGKISQELDPENPLTLGLYAVVLINAGKCQEALYYLEKALSIEPSHNFAYGQLLPAYECIGDYEKWIESWGNKVQGNWNDEGREVVLNAFQDRGYIGAIEEMFKMNEKYGNEGCFMSEGIKSERYLMLKNYDKVMDHFEMRYENNNHDPNLPYISTRSTYDKMKGNPRYLALLKKMNLPVSED
jgi:TolB-like protein/Tfp pilus assembly protein PilF